MTPKLVIAVPCDRCGTLVEYNRTGEGAKPVAQEADVVPPGTPQPCRHCGKKLVRRVRKHEKGLCVSKERRKGDSIIHDDGFKEDLPGDPDIED